MPGRGYRRDCLSQNKGAAPGWPGRLWKEERIDLMMAKKKQTVKESDTVQL